VFTNCVEIPFEKIVKVGAAYDEIGEYERSYLVFRATVESSFNRESSVAGFLEAQGEFLRSDESGPGGHVGHRSLRSIHLYCVQQAAAVTR